jgi:hypothetical protein
MVQGIFPLFRFRTFPPVQSVYRTLTKGDRGPENRVQFAIGRRLSDRSSPCNLGDIPLLSRKVRDLMPSTLSRWPTDRISAFDHALAPESRQRQDPHADLLFWSIFSDIVPNHVITAEVWSFPSL